VQTVVEVFHEAIARHHGPVLGAQRHVERQRSSVRVVDRSGRSEPASVGGAGEIDAAERHGDRCAGLGEKSMRRLVQRAG